MTPIVFYHHERADGGRRTGLTVGGYRALEQFEPGDESDRDSSLRWYFDVIHEVANPPDTQEAAAGWFAAHASDIRSAIQTATERLSNGADMDGLPWVMEYNSESGTRYRVAVSAMRRYVSTHVGDALAKFLAGDWESFVTNPPFVGEGVRAWPVVLSTLTN
ncbi:MAG: hypothetical protein ACRC7O_15725 [Fimbriiglobus sp.]